MRASAGFYRLLRLASRHLKEQEGRIRCDCGSSPPEAKLDKAAASKMIFEMVVSAFRNYIKEAECLGFNQADIRRAFYRFARGKILRRIEPLLEAVLIPKYENKEGL